jgi:hypothetical protein
MRAALLEPFRLQSGVKADPGLYTAAIELLVATLAYHPSLLDVMLFPTALQGSQDTVGPFSAPLHAEWARQPNLVFAHVADVPELICLELSWATCLLLICRVCARAFHVAACML